MQPSLNASGKLVTPSVAIVSDSIPTHIADASTKSHDAISMSVPKWNRQYRGAKGTHLLKGFKLAPALVLLLLLMPPLFGCLPSGAVAPTRSGVALSTVSALLPIIHTCRERAFVCVIKDTQ